MQCLRQACVQNVSYGLRRRTVLLLGKQPCRHGVLPNHILQSRPLSTDVLTTILTPPAVFGGLLVTLWTYKCMMMVAMQNKIIYMPGIPPFARSEKVMDYINECRPVTWQEHDLRSIDGTKLKMLEGCLQRRSGEPQPKRQVVVLYFQGNASSLPPRLPFLSKILAAANVEAKGGSDVDMRIMALSYRGYWSSKGSASQPGIELDAQAALEWILQREDLRHAATVIWGQSIGAGVATVTAATFAKNHPEQFLRISGLLLETPFVDLRAMLVAMYPQKFLPYRYLTPFLRSTWDSKISLEEIGNVRGHIRVSLLQAGEDEIVPDGQAQILEEVCKSRSLPVARELINGALHTEVMAKPQGRRAIAKFIASFAS